MDPEDETFFDMVTYFVDILTANKPNDYTIITRSDAQGLPAGIYRIGSYWKVTNTSSSGRVTTSRYKVYSMEDLPNRNLAPTKLKQWIEGKAQAIFESITNVLGIPFGPKDFGFFHLVLQTSGSGADAPTGTALDAFCEGDPEHPECKARSKKFPWIFLAIAAKVLLF